jgi:hypothetical protein
VIATVPSERQIRNLILRLKEEIPEQDTITYQLRNMYRRKQLMRNVKA